VHPVSQTRDPGQSVTFSVVATGTHPLGYQWFKDGVALVDGGRLSGATTPSLTITNLFPADAGNYWVVVSNSYGMATSAVARLTLNPDPVISVHPVSQTRDPGQSVTFSVVATGTHPLGYQWFKDGVALGDNERVVGSTTPNLQVSALYYGDAGNYWVVVSNLYGSVTSAVATLAIVAVTVDPTFNPGADGAVYALALQPDGKVLVGGDFTNLAGRACSRLGRLLPSGELDVGFVGGAAGRVLALVVQPDGKIVVGGSFSNLAGRARAYLGRLKPDGALDDGFNPQVDGTVQAAALQPDGKLLVGGDFTSVGGQSRSRLARLNPDGTLDETFRADASATVYCVAVQADGRIVVGGTFTSLAGYSRVRLARLQPDGGPWMRDLVHRPTVRFIAWQCSRMAGWWWVEPLPAWLGKRGAGWGG